MELLKQEMELFDPLPDLGSKNLYWEGGHRTYFVDEGNTWGGDTAQHRKMGGGTPHILC